MQCKEPKNQSKKDFLNRYLKAGEEIKTCELMIAELKDRKRSIKAVTFSDMPKGKNHVSDLSDYAAELDELEREVIESRRKAEHIRNEITRVIMRQEDPMERYLLLLKYIKGYTWKEIAADAGYTSTSRPRELHGEALEKLKLPG